MDFVDRDRGIQRVAAGARCHPLLILPFIIQVPDDRSGTRRRLRVKSERVGLIHLISVVTRYHVVFISVTGTDIRDETFPDSGGPAGLQLMACVVPPVKGTLHGDSLSVG